MDRLDVMGSTPDPSRPINLFWGKPAPALLPIEELAAAARFVFSEPSISVPSLEYGDHLGYQPLRRQVSSWLNGFYGSPDNPEHICITGGASLGLAVILQVLTDPVATRAVWLIAPCFYLACRMFEDAGLTGKLRSVKEGDEGTIDLEYLEQEMQRLDEQEFTNKKTTKPNDPARKTYRHVIYVVSTFSNPSGKTMPLTCRQKLVEVARRHDALIVSDDIYDCLQWSSSRLDSSVPKTAPLPRLVDIDRSLPPLASDPRHFGNAVSNGSFSKIIAPGLRTGWVDATPALAYALSECGSTRSGGGPSSQIVAAMIVPLVQSGFLQKHVFETLIPAYRRRREIMVDAIETHLGPLGVELVKISLAKEYTVGGFFLWMTLPDGVSSSTVGKMAKEEENLVVSPGATFVVTGHDEKGWYDHFLRVSFSYENEDTLVEGIVRLERVVRRLIKTRGHDTSNEVHVNGHQQGLSSSR
ncbi:MAG: putative secondary metabolism biosynthetic enzyme [Chaenotheca gracillima]|nr:MAG: putative secondary metabolism biosynthetic enzyme [Chaenotheca gracillima]